MQTFENWQKIVDNFSGSVSPQLALDVNRCLNFFLVSIFVKTLYFDKIDSAVS